MGAVLWRIRYNDRPPFDNLQGNPWSAPRTGVLVITQIDEQTGRFMQARSDFYVWRSDRWWGVDLAGLYDYLFFEENQHPKAALMGRTVSNPLFQKAFREAENDPDFPPRSARHWSEK